MTLVKVKLRESGEVLFSYEGSAPAAGACLRFHEISGAVSGLYHVVSVIHAIRGRGLAPGVEELVLALVERAQLPPESERVAP